MASTETDDIVIALVLNAGGVRSIRIGADSVSGEESAHRLLAKIGFELRQLDAALKRPATGDVFEPEPIDPNDAALTEAAQKLVRALGSASGELSRTLLDLAEFRGGESCASDLSFLSAKDLGYLLSAGFVRRAAQGGFCLNIERRNGRFDWAGTQER